MQPRNFVVREGFLGVGWGQGIGRGEKVDWGANKCVVQELVLYQFSTNFKNTWNFRKIDVMKMSFATFGGNWIVTKSIEDLLRFG